MTTEEWLEAQLSKAPRLTPAQRAAIQRRLSAAAERARKESEESDAA